MRIDILTLFPAMMRAVLDTSMLKIAREKGLAAYHLHDFRDFAKGPHRKVDDRPFGGGPGMVLKPEPIFECLEGLFGPGPALGGVPLIVPSPQGEPFRQEIARELAGQERLVFLCGHYEGFDERVLSGLPVREISIGDYVLTQGELATLVLVDAVVRLRPGVLGDADSVVEESFNEGLLDHPHYTRPVEYRGMTVPEVLRSGDHRKITEWRRERALQRTRAQRPDLLDDARGRPRDDEHDERR